jgi:hypothetical protein
VGNMRGNGVLYTVYASVAATSVVRSFSPKNHKYTNMQSWYQQSSIPALTPVQVFSTKFPQSYKSRKPSAAIFNTPRKTKSRNASASPPC